MPQVNDDGFMVHKLRKGGEVKEIKLRPVTYEEVQRRMARDEFEALTEDDLAPPAEPETAEPETVDVAEVQRAVRKREKPEGT